MATAKQLHLGNNLANVGADEDGRRLWHVPQRAEYGLRRSRIVLRVE